MKSQKKRRCKKIAGLVSGIVLCLVIVGWWFWTSTRPEGLYYDEHFSGTTYWLLEDGHVKLKSTIEDPGMTERVTDTGATYAKVGGQWVMQGPPELILKPGPFGLRTISEKPEWNRFLPRHGFIWLSNWGLLSKNSTNM